MCGYYIQWIYTGGFPGGVNGNEPACQCRRCERCETFMFNPWVRRSSGGGHGNPLRYSCLENSMERGAWWATVHRISKSQTWLKQLIMHTHICVSVLSHFSRVQLCVATWSVASVHGILQARIQEWVATPSSRGSSQSREQTYVS